MKQILLLILLTICEFLVGCATALEPNQVRVTFKSDPPGAMLYSQEKEWGMAPQTRTYTGNLSKGIIINAPVIAVWASGAKYSYTYPYEIGKEWTSTISRPKNAPGLEKDLNFAYGLKRKEAENSAALIGALGTVIDGYNGIPPGTASGSSNALSPTAPISRTQNTAGYVPGYQTRDSFGNLVNSRDSYQSKDSLGNLVNSQDSYQTRDSHGNLVNSRACFQTKDSNGNLVMSPGC